MTEQRFEFPWVQRSLNKWSRRHWAVIHREKKRLEAAAKAALLAQGARMIPGRVDVEVTLVFPAVRRRDRDNYSQKALNDALKGIVIEDDSSDVIVRQTVEFRVEPGCIPHTIVVVRPAGEDV